MMMKNDLNIDTSTVNMSVFRVAYNNEIQSDKLLLSQNVLKPELNGARKQRY